MSEMECAVPILGTAINTHQAVQHVRLHVACCNGRH